MPSGTAGPGSSAEGSRRGLCALGTRAPARGRGQALSRVGLRAVADGDQGGGSRGLRRGQEGHVHKGDP